MWVSSIVFQTRCIFTNKFNSYVFSQMRYVCIVKCYIFVSNLVRHYVFNGTFPFFLQVQLAHAITAVTFLFIIQ